MILKGTDLMQKFCCAVATMSGKVSSLSPITGRGSLELARGLAGSLNWGRAGFETTTTKARTNTCGMSKEELSHAKAADPATGLGIRCSVVTTTDMNPCSLAKFICVAVQRESTYPTSALTPAMS